MTDNHFEDIERYLDNRMDAAERSAFEARLARDTALAEALEQHRAANEAVKMYRDDQLREALRARSRKRLRPPRTILRVAAAAAAVLLLIVAVRQAVQYFARPGGEAPSGPVASLEEAVSAAPPAVPGNLAGPEADSIRRIWNEILRDFSAENYESARRQLEAMARDSTFLEYYSSRARLYLGYCHYRAGETGLAEAQLQAIPTTTGLWREAQFYRALNDIRAGREKQALERLRQIAADPQNKMQETAQRLIPLLEDRIR